MFIKSTTFRNSADCIKIVFVSDRVLSIETDHASARTYDCFALTPAGEIVHDGRDHGLRGGFNYAAAKIADAFDGVVEEEARVERRRSDLGLFIEAKIRSLLEHLYRDERVEEMFGAARRAA